MQLRSKNDIVTLGNQKLIKRQAVQRRRKYSGGNFGKPASRNLNHTVINISSSSQNSADMPEKCEGVPERRTIIIPQYKILPKITRNRNYCGQLRKGYCRYVNRPYPPRNLIELNSSDAFFIESNRKNFQFYSFQLVDKVLVRHTYQLLNEELLLQVYRICGDYKNEGLELKEILKLVAEQFTDPEHYMYSPVYEILKMQEPWRFCQLLQTYVERWSYRCKKDVHFQKNYHNNLSFTLYCLRQPIIKRRGRKCTNIYNKYFRLHRQTLRGQQNLEEYSIAVQQFEYRQNIFFHSVLNLLKLLRHVQYLSDQEYCSSSNLWSLPSSQKIIKRIISLINFNQISQQLQIHPKVKQQSGLPSNHQNHLQYKFPIKDQEE